LSEQPLFGEMLMKLGLVTPHQVQEALALQALTGQRVGEALISLGYVTRDQLQSALSEALGLAQVTPLHRPPLGELLVGLKHISAEQLDTALARQKRDGRKLGEILVEQGLCTYRQVYEGLALQQRMMDRKATEPAPAKKDKARVLVVDDSSLAVNLVREGLESLGYEVHGFTDPFEALEKVFRLRPDIVLSDLDMPGITGAELCRRLKTGPTRALPVIILTANDTDAQRVDGLRSGADDYVTKSASLEELAARIDSIVRRTGETERVRKLFARYTSDAVVEEILKSGEVVLTGENREVTLLFADIRNFTALAESLPPETVMDSLNRVLGQLSEAVLTCGGTLDKYLGDGLMAVFGAPVRHDDDALRALQAAKMMMVAMTALNDEGRPQGRPEMHLGIGINSGKVVVGSLGSAQRTEYTCIGDAVNVAARLCAAAAPGEILVGGRTVDLVGSGGGFEGLPPIRLKGKAQPVPLFRLPRSPSAEQKIAS
jgi:adenylate cyclase